MNPFKYGDRVRLVSAWGDSQSSARPGDHGTVIATGASATRGSNRDPLLVRVRMDDGSVTVRLASRFELATPTYKVGDKVRVVNSGGHSGLIRHFARVGAVGLVEASAGSRLDVRFDGKDWADAPKFHTFTQTVSVRSVEPAPIVPNPRGSVVYLTGHEGSVTKTHALSLPVGEELTIQSTRYTSGYRRGEPYFYAVVKRTGRGVYVSEHDLSVEKPVEVRFMVDPKSSLGEPMPEWHGVKVEVVGETDHHYRLKALVTRPDGYSREGVFNWTKTRVTLSATKPAPLSAFKPGDLVRVKDFVSVRGLYPLTRAKVVKVSGDLVTLVDDGTNTPSFVFGGLKTVSASDLEPRREGCEVRSYSPKVGDYVKVTAAQGSWRYSDVRGKVKSISAGQTFDGALHDYKIEVDFVDGERQIFTYEIHAIAVEKSEPPAKTALRTWAGEFFAIPEPKTFKVGDRVRKTGPHYIDDDAARRGGRIYNEAPSDEAEPLAEVLAWPAYGIKGSARVRWIGNGNTSVIATSSLTLAEPEKDFKVGDRVVVGDTYAPTVKAGSIGTVKEIHWSRDGRTCYGVSVDSFGAKSFLWNYVVTDGKPGTTLRVATWEDELLAPTPAPTFKVGDRVKVKRSFSQGSKEIIGTLTSVTETKGFYHSEEVHPFKLDVESGTPSRVWWAIEVEAAPAPTNAEKAAALIEEIEKLRETAYDSSEALDDKVDEALAFLKEIAE